MQNTKNIYIIKRIGKGLLNIKEEGLSVIWETAHELVDFTSPWNSQKVDKIVFRSLWDTETLFFNFEVEDPEVYIDTTNDTIESINNSDRVELFFRSDNSLNPYYCLEIDPTTRILDFKARPNNKFDFNWNWPVKDIEVKSSINKTGFMVVGAISISSLLKLGLIKSGIIETGVFRAKYNKQENGKYIPTWITWVDPNTETPNFHVASSFGIFKLENF
ncbi:sugar-binding protein [Confluentibacter flavum]|uniref:Endoxylanase n=1 Tax=Confluentibacter flavum TaxID=1909700 RepID=A0A2N3HHN1_9FLAO|nr:sugar-binding protein [Confluentibacter flavum]PKQ44404.1 endoxylanase [Confluentibacter flavum]